MIGAQSIGVRSSPCQALNWVLSRYGCTPLRPGRIPISWISSETISVPTTAAALLRVTDDSSSPMQTIAAIGIRYTSRLTYTSSSALGAETIVPDRLCSELKPDCRLPGDDRDRAAQQDRDHRVGGGRQRLAGEDLPALQRAREDRLERPVVILGGEDVARDQRRDQREHPDRAEQQDHERDRQPAAVQVGGEGKAAAAILPMAASGWPA